MTDVVGICNLTLAQVRGGSINDINESSVQAQQCKLQYPLCRDIMLSAGVAWGFANGIKPLAVLTDVIFNYAYVYQYPSDCMRINKLMPNWVEVSPAEPGVRGGYYDPLSPSPGLNQPVPYRVFNVGNNKVIASNEGCLYVDYVKKVTDPNLFSPSFVQGLSHLLAANIAVAVAGPEKGEMFRKTQLSLYKAYIDTASASDLNEQYTPISDSEHITIRG